MGDMQKQECSRAKPTAWRVGRASCKSVLSGWLGLALLESIVGKPDWIRAVYSFPLDEPAQRLVYRAPLLMTSSKAASGHRPAERQIGGYHPRTQIPDRTATACTSSASTCLPSVSACCCLAATKSCSMVVRRYMRSSSARISKFEGSTNKFSPPWARARLAGDPPCALSGQRTRPLAGLKAPVPPQQIHHPNFERVVGHHPRHQRDPQSANAGVAYQHPAVRMPASHGACGP